MLDTTIKAYATRQLGCLVLAGGLALGLFVSGSLDAKTSGVGSSSADRAAGPLAIGPRPPIAGPARVVDGDTIVVADVRIRLEGIDAPESSQTCMSAEGEPWPCGNHATRELIRIIVGHTVTCEDRGQDKYGRTLGVCYADGRDINADMVRRGFAWAFVRYSSSYVAQEAAAKAEKAGIWAGQSQPAWDYRARRWQTAEPEAPSGCAIKGNVTTNGRIYHLPWSPWYDKVKMDGERGKRWFCTEAEALAAGWRPAQTY